MVLMGVPVRKWGMFMPSAEFGGAIPAEERGFAMRGWGGGAKVENRSGGTFLADFVPLRGPKTHRKQYSIWRNENALAMTHLRLPASNSNHA